MFVRVATGNVWTEVPVVEARVADRSALSFRLRYDSRFAGGDSEFRSLFRQTVLGPGWTHSYNSFAFKGTNWGHTEFMVIDAQGRRRNYNPLSGGVGTAKMPGAFSWIAEPDASTYRVHYQNGSYEEYTLIDDVTPQYLSTIEDGLTRNGSYPEEEGDWYRLTKIVDRRGRTTELIYDHETTGLLTEIRDPYDNSTITLEYKPDTELLEEIHHPDGVVTILSYDDDDRLIGIQDPEQNSRTYTYKSTTDHRIESETLRNGVKYRIYYGNGSVEIKDTHPDGSPNFCYVKVWTDDDAWDDDAYYSNQTFQARTQGGTVSVRKGVSSSSWTYEVDDLGRVLSFTPPTDPDDPTSRTVVNTYDDETENFEAGTHTLTGTGTHWLRSRQVGDFAPTHYAYDAETGKITAIVDPEGNLTGYEHNDPNWPSLVTKKVEPDGDEWSYAYSAGRGDLLSENLTTNGGAEPSRTITYSYTYFSGGRPGRLEKRVRTDIHGNTTTWNFNSNGTIDSVVTDEGGLDVTTRYTHDVMGRLRTQTQVRDQNPDVEVEYFHDDAGRLTRTVVNSNGLALERVHELDGEGYLTAVTDPRGMVTRYEYDRRNRLTRQIVDSNGLALTTQYEYDLANNLTRITDPELHETAILHYKFALARLITDAGGYDSKLKWDALSNLSRIERERTPGSDEFYVTSMDYDGLSRLTSVVRDPDGLALETTYTYDADGGGCCCAGTPGTGLVGEITDPAGKHTLFQYDELDRLAKTIRKVGDIGSEPDDDDVVTAIEYDESNHLVDVLNPENELVRYTLDAAGRLSTRVVDPTTANLATTYSYDGNGPTRTVIPPNGNSITHTYDAAGRLTELSDLIDGQFVSYTYDADGNVLTITDGEGNLTSNGYDRVGRLISVKDPNGETETYTYDNNGNLARVIDREDREIQYEYDALDRIVRVTEDEADGGLKRVTDYTYDGLGNLLTLTAYTNTNGTGTVETTTYEYDSAARLTKVIYPDNDAGSNGIARFTYNPAGTIATRTDQNGVVTTYAYDDLHRLTNRSYDDGGVTPADTFEYDKAGRLVRASNANADIGFTYDDAGRLTGAD
ncbi:MAG: RHS repeat protein, partial [Phycisphaerae bacterium]|nr:RHS repeat protein [Phycisphaerae bacterium]